MNERDWTLLNAFADGELSRAEAEALSGRLEREPALAKELTRLQALKSRTAELRMSPRLDRAGRARPGVRAAGVAVAASVLLAAFVGLALFDWSARVEPRGVVLSLHSEFSAAHFPEVVADLGLAEAAEIPPPDLSDSNLRLVATRRIREPEVQAIGYHYRGPRGCRVTLVVGTALDLPAEIDLGERWMVGDRVLMIVADGMDPQRFAAIARFARAATEVDGPDSTLRLALVERTAAARPCA